MKANESAAYLKGLFEGLSIDRNSPEGKLFDAAITAIGALSERVEELSAKLHDMGEYVEDMDDDLSAVEEIVFGDEDDEDEYDEDDEENEDDDQYYEITCPKCGETICFDDSLESDELTCPACGEHLELEFECDGDCSACEKDCPVVEDPADKDNAD